MHFFHLLTLLLTTHLTQALAQQVTNTSQEFYLRTVLKPDQSGKERFANLYVTPFHTGAGFNDAVLSKGRDKHAKAFLNQTVGAVDGTSYHRLIFDIYGYPYDMDMELYTATYAAWQPVEINVVYTKPEGFYFNDHGLQWTNLLHKPPTSKNTLFDGWLVCEWYHDSFPQLFFRDGNFYNAKDFPAPCSCADVYLMPEYI